MHNDLIFFISEMYMIEPDCALDLIQMNRMLGKLIFLFLS